AAVDAVDGFAFPAVLTLACRPGHRQCLAADLSVEFLQHTQRQSLAGHAVGGGTELAVFMVADFVAGLVAHKHLPGEALDGLGGGQLPLPPVVSLLAADLLYRRQVQLAQHQPLVLELSPVGFLASLSPAAAGAGLPGIDMCGFALACAIGRGLALSGGACDTRHPWPPVGW